MIGLRNKIRKILFETIATTHFKERIKDRLDSNYTNFSEEKEGIKQRIYDDIDFLETIQFPGQHNIGVLLGSGSIEYEYHREVGGKVEHSQGRYVWVVIRANFLETIVFGDRDYVPRNTQYQLRIERIKEFVQEENGGVRELDDKSLRKLLSPKQKSSGGYRKVPAEFEGMPVVTISGKEYFVDEPNEQVVYTKNTKRTLSFDEVLDTFPEEEGMKIFDQDYWS